ncbi:replication endonuclease [Halomonas sp. BC1]|uniref:replication endonuclease n=1 Tax=Halomonas sp. BC1 TaxID=1670448 RepID=UPI0009BD8604|nr:replication endonuclease [Halomonas sp. BC1]
MTHANHIVWEQAKRVIEQAQDTPWHRQWRKDKAFEQAQGTPWCRKWRQDKVFSRFPLIANDLMSGFVTEALVSGGGLKGNAAGNTWLREQSAHLVLGAFNVTHDAQALEDYAHAKAEGVYRLVAAAHRKHKQARAEAISQRLWSRPCTGVVLSALRFKRFTMPTKAEADAAALAKALHMAESHCIDVAAPHLVTEMTANQRAVLLAKLSSAAWWRRRLRALAIRRLEQFQREAKRVHKRAGIYISQLGFEAWQGRRRASDAMLEGTVAVNQFEQEYTLKQLAEVGVANPDIRHAEVMTRIRDTEVEANRKQHQGVFVTWTLPSRWHAVHAANSQANAKYRGATPRQAQAQLQALWARARAKLARDGIAIYGLRVVEPHHDGTPHWHLLLWVDPEQLDGLKQVLTHYALSIDPGEVRGQIEKRIRFEDIDPSRGSAAGYVLKYVTKNINKSDQHGDVDQYGHELSSSAPRIAAWSSTWGIRQFQFIGLPSVTVWRELRRLRDADESPFAAASHEGWIAATRPEPEAVAYLETLRRAANAGDWDKYLQLTGGVGSKARKRPVRPWTITRMDTSQSEADPETGEVSDMTKRGQYGESISAVMGVVVTTVLGETEFLTRFYRWEVKQGVQRSGAAAQPWTRVNNCTGPDITPRQPPAWVASDQQKRYQAWRESPEAQQEMIDLQAYEQELQKALKNTFKTTTFSDEGEYFPPELGDYEPQRKPATVERAAILPSEESQAFWQLLTSSSEAPKREALGIDDQQALRLAAMYFKPPHDEQAQWMRLMQPSLREALKLPNGKAIPESDALSMAAALWESPTPRVPIT